MELIIDEFHPHSLRAGCATTLYAAGADPVDIQRWGRWQSSIYMRYIWYDNMRLHHLSSALTAPHTIDGTYESRRRATEKCNIWRRAPRRRITRRGTNANMVIPKGREDAYYFPIPPIDGIDSSGSVWIKSDGRSHPSVWAAEGL